MREEKEKKKDSHPKLNHATAFNVLGIANPKLITVPTTKNVMVHVACPVTTFIMMPKDRICAAMMKTRKKTLEAPSTRRPNSAHAGPSDARRTWPGWR